MNEKLLSEDFEIKVIFFETFVSFCISSANCRVKHTLSSLMTNVVVCYRSINTNPQLHD